MAHRIKSARAAGVLGALLALGCDRGGASTAALGVDVRPAAAPVSEPRGDSTPEPREDSTARPEGVLRVCADPNNLPFSNARSEGFENRVAELIARELGWKVEYAWHAQRRGFFRNTLKARLCDAVMSVPAELELVATTRPYYSSSYAFVQPRAVRSRVRSLDDPALEQLRVGVQLIGDDMANAPPAHALAARGLIEQIVGFTVYGDYTSDAPQRPIVDAVADGTIDVAVVWGPTAGYFARSAARALVVTPVRGTRPDDPKMEYAMAVGVRHGDDALRNQIDAVLARRVDELRRILRDFSFPPT